MKIKIYQVNLDRDTNGVAFESFKRLPDIQNSEMIYSELYDLVFDGEVDCSNLEDVYRKFNLDHPEGYKGRSLSVSDVVEVVESKEVESGFYYCDSIGYQQVEFDPSLAQVKEETKIKVVYCEPGKLATVKEIATDLENLQNEVGGNIEAFYPFEEEVCLVCNDEGKFNGSQPCRGVFDDNGELIDIIFGSFFICDCSTEEFGSLTDEQLKKYLEMYKYPERFIRINDRINALKYNPKEEC